VTERRISKEPKEQRSSNYEREKSIAVTPASKIQWKLGWSLNLKHVTRTNMGLRIQKWCQIH